MAGISFPMQFDTNTSSFEQTKSRRSTYKSTQEKGITGKIPKFAWHAKVPQIAIKSANVEVKKKYTGQTGQAREARIQTEKEESNSGNKDRECATGGWRKEQERGIYVRA